MTNTTAPAQTATGIVCGKCSTGFGPARVVIRHAGVAEVRACFTAPVVEVPTPAQVVELFIVPEAAPLKRYFASCPRKSCTRSRVADHPFTLRCYAHGRTVRVASKQLFGKLSTAAKHKCNSACTGAVGPVCTCSCAGVNHGVDHLVGV